MSALERTSNCWYNSNMFIRLIFLMLFFASCAASARAESVMRRYYIEGIVSDPENKGSSLAVINGETYKVGDTAGEYLVADIFSNGAKLKHLDTGEEKVLLVGRDAPPAWLIEEDYLFDDVESQEAARQSDRESSTGGPSDDLLNPFTAIQRAREASVMARLVQLRMALEVYRSEQDAYPESLEQLADRGYIELNMYQGWEDYEFFYKSGGQRFSLWADPKKPSKGTRYYYVDDTGVVRSERGLKADWESPAVQS